MNKVIKFVEITEQMNKTYQNKNKDYGDSFGESIKKYGLISALTRISDKFNRLENLILNRHEEIKVDESLKDTLLDLACYSIMTIIELEKTDLEDKEKRTIGFRVADKEELKRHLRTL